MADLSHPYADLIGFRVIETGEGRSVLEARVRDVHRNPHGVVHGGVMFSMADTGMGAALYSVLQEGESCGTINCAISYFKGVTEGVITCKTAVRNKGRKVATLESEIWNDDRLVATAHGQFSIMVFRKG